MKFWNYIGEFFLFRWLIGKRNSNNYSDQCGQTDNSNNKCGLRSYEDFIGRDFIDYDSAFDYDQSLDSGQSFDDFNDEQDDYDIMDDLF